MMNWFKNLFKKQKEKVEYEILYDFDKYDFVEVDEIILNNDPEIKWWSEDGTSSLYGWTESGIILSLKGISLEQYRAFERSI